MMTCINHNMTIARKLLFFFSAVNNIILFEDIFKSKFPPFFLQESLNFLCLPVKTHLFTVVRLHRKIFAFLCCLFKTTSACI